MTQQGDEEYMTPDEASTFLGVSRRTLERYVENKYIKKYRRMITREVFFKRSELTRFAQERLEITPEDE